MRGYFGIRVEGISKPMNVGNLFRTAHAFGASFLFTVNEDYSWRKGGQADTSAAPEHVPLYNFPDIAAIRLPGGCRLVGVELTAEAIELPSFRHPNRAAYVLGPERGSLSPALMARCDYVVRVPTRFCLNVGVAGALVMYDRLLTTGRFAERPVSAGGPLEPPTPHVHGLPIRRKPAE
ncbi:MAG: RNA methyltransferase [Alphaproteobacteria bacterium]|nr:RNA methyltransferase [Alphaproteobacteria bacterium]